MTRPKDTNTHMPKRKHHKKQKHHKTQQKPHKPPNLQTPTQPPPTKPKPVSYKKHPTKQQTPSEKNSIKNTKHH